MADKSPIEWTDATWNPVVGCSIVSPGCTHCYAMKMAGRIEAMGSAPHYAGTTKKVNGNTIWTGKLALAPEKTLLQPLAWRTPRRIFVNSMGDLFHEDVPDEWIDRVFAIMALAPQHTFQVLTKRAKRMREYMTTAKRKRSIAATVMDISEALARQAGTHEAKIKLDHFSRCFAGNGPFSNVWLGVSAERQQEADERIPDLLATPAALRFVSAEPLLGPIDFTRIARQPNAYDQQMPGLASVTRFYVDALTGNEGIGYETPRGEMSAETCFGHKLDWIIVGGESGPDARGMHPAWARSIRDQCATAGVPFFFKHWGAWQIAESVNDDRGDDWRFWRFPDGDEFHIVSDGHDIVMCTAQDAKAATHIWGGYWADGHGNLAKRSGKKAAGRLLDGIEHNGMPEMREVPAL